MKKTMPIFAIILMSIFFTGSFPSITQACSCAELPSAEEEFERSQAVFRGKVMDVREKRSLNGELAKSVLFEVESIWKGIKQSQVIIITGLGGGDCGFNFIEGQTYLVYASESTMYGEKSLVTTVCNRTNKLSVLQEDLTILGAGQPPIEEVDLTGSHEGSQYFIWGIAVIAIGIVFIFLFKRRK